MINTYETREVEIHLEDGTSKYVVAEIVGQYAVYQTETEHGHVGWSVSHILSGMNVSNNKAVFSLTGNDFEARCAAIDLARKLSWIDSDWYWRDGCRDKATQQRFISIYRAWRADWS